MEFSWYKNFFPLKLFDAKFFVMNFFWKKIFFAIFLLPENYLPRGIIFQGELFLRIFFCDGIFWFENFFLLENFLMFFKQKFFIIDFFGGNFLITMKVIRCQIIFRLKTFYDGHFIVWNIFLNVNFCSVKIFLNNLIFDQVQSRKSNFWKKKLFIKLNDEK